MISMVVAVIQISLYNPKTARPTRSSGFYSATKLIKHAVFTHSPETDELPDFGHNQNDDPADNWDAPTIPEVDAGRMEDGLHEWQVNDAKLEEDQNTDNVERHLVLEEILGNDGVVVSQVEEVENLTKDDDVQ